MHETILSILMVLKEDTDKHHPISFDRLCMRVYQTSLEEFYEGMNKDERGNCRRNVKNNLELMRTLFEDKQIMIMEDSEYENYYLDWRLYYNHPLDVEMLLVLREAVDQGVDLNSADKRKLMGSLLQCTGSKEQENFINKVKNL